MRARRGQETIQAALVLPVLVLLVLTGCWLLLWQLAQGTTQFVAQEAGRAASQTSALPSDPDAVTQDPDADDSAPNGDPAFVASQAKSAAQSAIDRSFLRGAHPGSPCPNTPGRGQVCFVQMQPCTQGSGSGASFCANQGVPQCLNGASSQQALWVCEWYEVPAAGSGDPYKVKVIVVGWYNVGLPLFNGGLPITTSDEESIQRCGGCPG